MAQTFYPITPVEVTPSTANSWQDVDVSANVPSGATGVILHIVNTYASADYDVGLRKNGSSDDRHSDFQRLSHSWGMIGVDANRVFEAYVQSTTYIDIYVVGYTKSGVTFATNATDKAAGAVDSWLDMNCSTEAPNAIGLIFEIDVGATYSDFGLRKNGSSDDRIYLAWRHSAFGAVIGCDASQICEGQRSKIDLHFWLVGYITDGVTFNTNATDVSLGTAGSWLDLSALPSGANMGILESPGTCYSYNWGWRKNGSSEDICRRAKHIWGIVECDANRIIEGKIEDTVIDFFVVGYSEVVTITEKSSSEAGSGSEASSQIAILSKPDSGSGSDALTSFLAALAKSDVGSGVDAYVEVVVIGQEFFSSDAGAGIDSLAVLNIALDQSDAGKGTETLLSRLLHHADSGLGTDAYLALLAALARAEVGTGVGIKNRGCVLDLASSRAPVTPAAGWEDTTRWNNDGAAVGAPVWVRLPSGLWTISVSPANRIDVPHDESLSITTNITILFWVNFPSLYPTNIYTFSKALALNNNNYAMAIIDDAINPRFRFLFRASIGGVDATLSFAIYWIYHTGWYFIVWPYDSVLGGLLFVNGIQRGGGYVGGGILDTQISALQIGAFAGAGDFTGSFAKFRIFNYTMSGAEIWNIFNSERWMFGDKLQA